MERRYQLKIGKILADISTGYFNYFSHFNCFSPFQREAFSWNNRETFFHVSPKLWDKMMESLATRLNCVGPLPFWAPGHSFTIEAFLPSFPVPMSSQRVGRTTQLRTVHRMKVLREGVSSPVDIIDISVVVTWQSTHTLPHWITTRSRDAYSKVQSSIINDLVPCMPTSFPNHPLLLSLLPIASLVPRPLPSFSLAAVQGAWERGYPITTAFFSPRVHISMHSIRLFTKVLLSQCICS